MDSPYVLPQSAMPRTALTHGNSSRSDENLRPQPAPRKRPLRTYGRRARHLSDRDSEPPRKKRAVEDRDSNNNDTVGEEPCLPPLPQLPQLPARTPATPSIKRGSILAFFRPVPAATSSSAPASELSSQPTRDELVPSSPPSSPPTLITAKKRKRRLTTRINALGDVRPGAAGQNEEEPEGPQATGGCFEADQEDGDGAEPNIVSLGHSPVLQELQCSLLNSGIPASGCTAERGFKVKHEAKRRPRKATVQTTLNLSPADDPGFTICKDCGMLYNPLNEKDRKDHAKQHAAVMREEWRVPV